MFETFSWLFLNSSSPKQSLFLQSVLNYKTIIFEWYGRSFFVLTFEDLWRVPQIEWYWTIKLYYLISKNKNKNKCFTFLHYELITKVYVRFWSSMTSFFWIINREVHTKTRTYILIYVRKWKMISYIPT